MKGLREHHGIPELPLKLWEEKGSMPLTKAWGWGEGCIMMTSSIL